MPTPQQGGWRIEYSDGICDTNFRLGKLENRLDINNGKLNWNGFSWSFQQRTVCLKYEIVVPCAHGVAGGQQNPLKGKAAILVGGAEGTA